MQSDEELIDRINRGSAEAFETLYFRYRDRVYRLAWRFSGNETDASDVLQEVFGYLLSKFPGFELRAALMTFLYPAVKHIAIRIREKRERMGVSEVIPEVETETTDRGGREDLKIILEKLPQEQQEVLLMRFVDDMTLAEIAQALEIPVGTVRSRLHRALEVLREDPKVRAYFFE